MNPLSNNVVSNLNTEYQPVIKLQGGEEQGITQVETQLSCFHITRKNMHTVNLLDLQMIQKLVVSSEECWWYIDLSKLNCDHLQELDLSVSAEKAPYYTVFSTNNDTFSKLPQKVRTTIEVLKITGQKALSEIGIFPKLRELHATSTPVSHIDNFHDLYLEELHIHKLTQQDISSFNYLQKQKCIKLSIHDTNEIEDLGEFPNLVELTLIGAQLPKLERSCGIQLKKLHLCAHDKKYEIDTDLIQSEKLEELLLYRNIFFKNSVCLKNFLTRNSQTLHTLRLNYYHNPIDFDNLSLPNLKTLKLSDSLITSAHLENISKNCPSLQSLEIFWHSEYKNDYTGNDSYKNVKFDQVTELILYYYERKLTDFDFYRIDAMFPNLQRLSWFLHHEKASSIKSVSNSYDCARRSNKGIFKKGLCIELNEWI